MSLRKAKNKKRKIIVWSVIGAFFLVIISATMIVLGLLSRIEYVLTDSPTFEVMTDSQVAALFSEIKSGSLENGEATLDTAEVGEKSVEVTLSGQLGNKQVVNIPYLVDDTTPPTIKGEDKLELSTTDDADLLSQYETKDNSEKEAKLTVEGDYDLKVAGEYKVKIVAEDESGNRSEKEVTLKVSEPPRPVVAAKSNIPAGMPYYIEVNRQQNVVVVFSRDQNGNYSNIAKVFVASTGAPGSETPLGTFTISDRYEALYLVGNVWGHYTVRISGPFFFHSVPYFTKGAPTWDNLEYLEYNKLGSGASAGCVRLAAADAKWIYDNIGAGTTVKIYDSASLPPGVAKPAATRIDETDARRGWDPTDPDPNNPWH